MTNTKLIAAELAAIAAECEHEDEVERLREEEWESDYAADPSGQTDSGPCGPEPEVY